MANRIVSRTTVMLAAVFVASLAYHAAPAAARMSDAEFQREWSQTKVDLSTRVKPVDDGMNAKISDKPSAKKSSVKHAHPDADDFDRKTDKTKKKTHQRGSSAAPDKVDDTGIKRSHRAVCQSQCNLERMSCDMGRTGTDAFQNRADQLKAAQQSCFLAVQGCLSRC